MPHFSSTETAALSEIWPKFARLNPMNSIRTVFFLFALGTPALATATDLRDVPSIDNPNSLPVVKLSPKVRTESRSEDYFSSIPCKQIHRATANNPREANLIVKRKGACMKRFGAFTHKNVAR